MGYSLTKTLLPKGCGAVFSCHLKGDRATGRRMVKSLKIFSYLANVGDAKLLVIYLASTTHICVPSEQLAAAAFREGTLRLSIGLENVDDLIEDLSCDLKMSQRT